MNKVLKTAQEYYESLCNELLEVDADIENTTKLLKDIEKEREILRRLRADVYGHLRYIQDIENGNKL